MSDMLDKIGKLLAQAEGTNVEAERDAFITKAQELATAYSIDLELARQRQTDKTKREVPTVQRSHIGRGIAQHRARFVRLYSAIADSNNVKLLIAMDSSFVDAHGFPSDIDVVERLYASLAVQMVRACEDAIKAGEHKKPENRFYSEERWDWRKGDWVGGKYRTDARVFRGNFYAGFTQAIRQRLHDARKEALKQEVKVVSTDSTGHEETTVSTGALVLKPREVEVSDFLSSEIKRQGIRGSWRGASTSTHLSGAHNSGRQAGERANLGGSRAIGGGQRSIAS